MEQDDWYEREGEPRFRAVAEIGQTELYDGLCGMAGLAENPFLAMQAQQLCLVDNVLMGMEQAVLGEMMADARPSGQRALLAALSPMWIYAAYELLRTWRQRAIEVVRLAENGGIDMRARHLEQKHGYTHYDRELRARQLRDAKDDPELVQRMRDDLARTEIGFTMLECIRVALAKHEEASSNKKKKPIAFAPGLALINRDCGSMEYEVSVGGAIIQYETRRGLAETLRQFPTMPVPSPEELADFRAYMNPPDFDAIDAGPTGGV